MTPPYQRTQKEREREVTARERGQIRVLTNPLPHKQHCSNYERPVSLCRPVILMVAPHPPYTHNPNTQHNPNPHVADTNTTQTTQHCKRTTHSNAAHPNQETQNHPKSPAQPTRPHPIPAAQLNPRGPTQSKRPNSIQEAQPIQEAQLNPRDPTQPKRPNQTQRPNQNQ